MTQIKTTKVVENLLEEVKFVPVHSHIDSRRTMFRLYNLDNFSGDINLSIVHPGSRTNFHMHHRQTDMVAVIGGELDFFVCDAPVEEGGEFRTYHLNREVLVSRGLLCIPPYLFHGSKNDFSEDAYLIYRIDQHYNPDDEYRMTWQEMGFDWYREVK